MDIKKRSIKDQMLPEDGTYDHSIQQKILHDRALELSKLQNEENNENIEDLFVVKFLLSGEIYCIEADYVKEALPLKELTVVPCTPSFILGVVNIRGQIFTVLNLKKVFNLSEKGISEFNKVILIQFEEISFGIVADAILGTRFILRSAINKAPYATQNRKNDYISGVTSEGLIILDGKALIQSSELVVNQKQNKENKF
jgi:purine-binding chemotaxis protein CheW